MKTGEAEVGSEAEVPPPFPNHEHPPVKWLRRGSAKYQLFSAARRGCMQCVVHWTSQNRSAALWSSDNNNWTAIDWAREGVDKDYADNAALHRVIEYLDTLAGES